MLVNNLVQVMLYNRAKKQVGMGFTTADNIQDWVGFHAVVK